MARATLGGEKQGRHRQAASVSHLKSGDLSHIQAFDDKPLDSVGSLIALMETLSTTNWSTALVATPAAVPY